MSDSAAELAVVFRGKEVGLRSLITAIERGLKQADAQAQKSEQAALQLAGAHVRLATAAERLTQAENQTAGSMQRLAQSTAQTEAAQSRAALAALRLEQAQLRVGQAASNSGIGALPRTFAGLTTEMQGAATGMLSFGAAISAAAALAQSFGEAVDFKANLDATTASVGIQLNGIRDSGQVFAEAQAYGNEYKLTQQEIADTVQASVGIFRTSKASVEDTFGVLQRLTVLAPGKSIQDAAFSVRELASGDITSIAEQFNISRGKAYEMRDAINGGADAITVLSAFLDQSGVSMDALKVKTEGVLGAQKDLAIAQEQLALSQAAFAQGPGLTLLQAQIDVTRGATRALSGDFGQMAASLEAAVSGNDPLAGLIASLLRGGQASSDFTDELARGTSGGQQWGAAQTTAATAANQVSAAAQASALSLAEEAAKKAESASQGEVLAGVQARLAQLGAAVQSGSLTAAQGAAVLANQYSLTTQQAELLINAQARLAGGEARLAAGRANTRDSSGGVGFNAPGRSGRSDADTFSTFEATIKANLAEQAAQQQALVKLELAKASAAGDVVGQIKIQQRELSKLTVGSAAYLDKQAEIVQLQAQGAKGGKGGKGGGAAKTALNAQRTANNQEEDQERAHQVKLAQIATEGAKKRAEADEVFRRGQLTGRSSFYASQAGIEDAAQRASNAARFEAIQQEADAIKQTQGSDVAQAYKAAAVQALQSQSQIEQDIAQAQKAASEANKGADRDSQLSKAEYLQGLLALQKAADDDELNSIKSKGSAIANEQAAHLDKIALTYERKVAALPGLKATLGAAENASITPPNPLGQTRSATSQALSSTATPAPTPSGQAQPVIDIATPAAVDQQTGQLLGALNSANSLLADVASRISAVERAVSGLKSSRAFAP